MSTITVIMVPKDYLRVDNLLCWLPRPLFLLTFPPKAELLKSLPFFFSKYN